MKIVSQSCHRLGPRQQPCAQRVAGQTSPGSKPHQRRAACVLWLALSLALLSVTASQSGEPASACLGTLIPLPPDERLEQCGAVVGSIDIRIEDVFDTTLPEEDRWLFRLANRLHPRTREWVVRQQLLFREGDPYDSRLLVESERLLRANRYFYDARVRPTRVSDNAVDIGVVVRDVWTLEAGVGFGRQGGANSFRAEIEDVNFLGTGKDLTLEWTSDVDRDRTLLRYRDPNIAGSHARVEAWYATYSDGYLHQLDAERPFYALDERWSAALHLRRESRVDDLYSLGEVTASFGHYQDLAEVSGGLSRGLRQGRAWRWLAGATYQHDRFSPVAEDPGALLPADRVLAYPWIGVELAEDSFATAHDMDQIVRTEDLELGTSLRARLGWSAPAFGGDRQRAVLDAEIHRGLTPGSDHRLFLEAHASGRWTGDGSEDLLIGGSARSYWRDLGPHLLFVTLEADIARNLDRDHQLLLGGEDGLRGYPLRYQNGERRVLLTVEQRFYSNWHLLRLAHVGGAVFVDIGRAWFRGAQSPEASGVLSDVGAGLRLGLSRSGRGTMLHIDVAYPLDRGPGVPGIQLLVSSKESF